MRRNVLIAACVSLGLLFLVHRILAAEGTVGNGDPGEAMKAVMTTGELPDANPPVGKVAEVHLVAPTGNTTAWTGEIKKLTRTWIVVESGEKEKSTVWIPLSRVEYVRVLE